MLFNDNTKYESINYPFNWGVDYNDGTSLKEFDENGSNDYYSIETDKIKSFGVYGCGMKMFYQEDGSLYLNGKVVEIEFHTDDKVYHLTTNFDKKDCITYKQVELDIVGEGRQKDVIVSYNFGYKKIIQNDDIQFYFKPIVVIPVVNEQPVHIITQLTSNKNIKGKLVYKRNGKVIHDNDIALKLNYAILDTWIVK